MCILNGLVFQFFFKLNVSLSYLVSKSRKVRIFYKAYQSSATKIYYVDHLNYEYCYAICLSS